MCLDHDSKISIILPVYNVEKYLKQSLDSLINQTYKNLEILCIDDGSTDNSMGVLKEYSQKDKRIRIFSQENSGQGKARNRGIDEATGKYIVFLDPDDWCIESMCERLLKTSQEKDVDFTFFAATVYDETKDQFYNDMKYYSLRMFSQDQCNQILTRKDIGAKLFTLPVMAWGKFFKTSFLREHKIRFVEGYAFEDNAFFIDIFFSMKNFSVIKDQLIFYRVNRKGSDTQVKGKKHLDFVFQVAYFKDVIERFGLYDEYEEVFLKHAFSIFDSRLEEIQKELKPLFFQKAREFILSLKISDRVLEKSLIIRENYKMYQERSDFNNDTNEKGFFYKAKKFIFLKKITARKISYLFFNIQIYKINRDEEKFIFGIRIM